MIYLSPSQIATWLDCPRKWWSEKVAKLPVPERRQQLFGTVAHACIMRFLGGEEVYPNEWEVARSPFGDRREIGRLGPEEQAEVKARMIDWTRGMQALPGQRLEEEFKIPVPEGVIMGRMDQRAGTLVVDHKTSRDARFVPTSEQLAADPKMRLYGVAALRAERGAPSVELRLQYFFRIEHAEPMIVRAAVSAAELRDWWKVEVLPLIAECVKMKQEALPADRWNEILGPRREGACDAYGGCHFLNRCFKSAEDVPF